MDKTHPGCTVDHMDTTKIVALAGQKGGAGKTTTAISIAVEWHRQGKNVLLVDADTQGTALTWAAVASEKGHQAPTVIAMGEGLHRPDQLPKLAAAFDIVVIDCPGRDGAVQRSSLLLADLAILPCGPSAADAWALARSSEVVGQARAARPALDAAVLITRKTRTAIAGAAREVLGAAGLPVLASEIGFRVAYQEMLPEGLGPTTYEPNGEAAREIRSLCEELAARLSNREEVVHAVG